MAEEKLYHRQPYETEMSWVAFSDYLLMEKPRTLIGLHAAYTQPTRRSRPPTSKLPTLQHWYRSYQWKERAAEFDEEQSAIAIKVIAERAQHSAIANIQEFSDVSRRSGKTGVTIANNFKVYMAQQMEEGLKDKKGFNAGTLELLEKAARIVKAIEKDSHEMWATAIGIDKLLLRLEED